MKFGFYLMGSRGKAVLLAVLAAFGAGAIAYVVGAKDARQVDHYAEISALCRDAGVPFYDRGTEPAGADYAFAVSWRWLIDAPNLIVLHDSFLPWGRGHAPLVTSLIAGREYLGVTALLASDRADAGDIISQELTQISYPMKIAAAIEFVTPMYIHQVLAICEGLLQGKPLTATPQDERAATYSPWRDEDDYKVDWNLSAAEIRRFVDAVGYPYAGAKAQLNGITVRIREVEEAPESYLLIRTPGKVTFLDNGIPTVVCGKGLLKITDMRLENGESALPLRQLRSRFA